VEGNTTVKPGVTVVVPFHPARERNGMLDRAAASVRAQTVPVELLLARDVYAKGAAMTRQCGLAMVETEWTAFLDSDDTMDPDHIEHLLSCASETGADYVYPWFRVAGGSDPFPMFFGRPWDNDAPHQTTITILVRTGLAQSVGFMNVPPGSPLAPDGNRGGEDWIFTLGCMAAGAQIVHLPRRSWTWHHGKHNSSGCPDRGDAAGR
jgi:glycosyltransferase involved in cell wall biosynthesis